MLLNNIILPDNLKIKGKYIVHEYSSVPFLPIKLKVNKFILKKVIWRWKFSQKKNL